MATDSIIDLTDNDDDIVLIAVNGETVTCSSSDGDIGPRNYYDAVVVAEGYTSPVVSVRSELRTSP